MIVCICHYVSDRDIEREVRQGCASFEALQEDTFVATACGACDGCARHTFERVCAGASAQEHRTQRVPHPQHGLSAPSAPTGRRRLPALQPISVAAAA